MRFELDIISVRFKGGFQIDTVAEEVIHGKQTIAG